MNQRGFALVTILVLVATLIITAYMTAAMTRVDTQIVNTTRNERIAFHAAEAGIAEAQMRLGLTSATNVTVAGVGTFNPAFTGTFAPDSSTPAWNAQIVFTGSGTYPSKTGNTVTTPSIQPATSRVDYSTSTLGDATNLRMAWAICTAVVPGCTAANVAAGAIRTNGGLPVLQIISTGRAGLARRRVTLDLTINTKTSTVVLRSDACPGVRTQGSGQVNFPASVVVNSTCATAMSAGGSSSITAAGSVKVVGSGYSGNISPTPSTGAAPLTDPLASLAVPYPPVGSLVVRNGTALVPIRLSIGSTLTLNPGIYYGGIAIASGGNVTLNPGVYVMAGGGFAVTANGQVRSATGGVMIYNTCNRLSPLFTTCSTSGVGAYGAINVSSTRAVTLSAPTAATSSAYQGILFFQDRANATALTFSAGAEGLIDGLIYAPIATLALSGNADLIHSQLLVGAVDLSGGPVIGEPTVWLNLTGGSGVPTAVAWTDN